jgi:type VI secretion system secreted protein Hcp
MAGNLFLQIEGVTGECVEANHKGWIDVGSYTEGLHSSSTAGFGGGSGLGTVSYQDISINCQLEKAVPTLMAGCAGHKHYGKATLHAVKMGGEKSWNYLEITLTDVVVTGVNFSGSSNDMPHVSITLAFAKIKTEYFEQTSSGGKGSSTVAEWNQKENQKV